MGCPAHKVQTVIFFSGDQKNVTADQKERCSSLSRQLEALELWWMQTRPQRECAVKTSLGVAPSLTRWRQHYFVLQVATLP